jgi:hypothetical protein
MVKTKGNYRHFKGGIYKVILLAKDSETKENVVVYENINEPNEIWVRPESMFSEKIVFEGKEIYRFTLIE